MFIYNIMDWFKNSMQYVLGALLYFAIFGNLDVRLLMLGLAGVVISYNSVYYMNDIIDYKNDKKDAINRKMKPLITGKFSKKEAVVYCLISLMIGLPLSFAVSRTFGMIVALLLFLNILHSTLMKRMGIKAVASNMFVIQLIKYSLGWFALTLTLDKFPLFTFAAFSAAYVTFYIIYKKKLVLFNESFYYENKGKGLKDSIKITLEEVFNKNKMLIIPVILTAASYLISIIFYPFRLQLILLVPLIAFISLAAGRINFTSHIVNVKASRYLTIFSLFVFILFFSLLQNPVVAQINESMNDSVNAAQQKLSNSMPQSLKEGIDNVNCMIHSDRENLENFLLNLTK
ncbi:MAG: UbiA family prenyltransferase [Nanoarchaeota archaeon]|nr:UbiA family prenyltransferase [Nanoarchaeota archaeon]